MNPRAELLLPLLLLLPLTACTDKPAATESSAAAQPAVAEIHWQKGDVEAAFAAAKAQQKPVILYWGAEWCPPCHQLQATVFSRPDFIEKSKLFISVYLDGDLEGAQKWGEQFKVTGYPTLVVLDAERREIMRIAGGMDLALYASVLDEALSNLKPVDEVLARTARGESLDQADCRRLAYNAWVLDDIDDAAIADQAQQLRRAAAACPAAQAVERARLQIVAAYYAANAEAKQLGKGGEPSAALRADIELIGQLLPDPALTAPNADVLMYLPDEFYQAVRTVSKQRAGEFNTRLAAVMDAAAANPRLAEADQLNAVGTKLQAARHLTGGIPDGLKREANATLERVITAEQIPYVRSSILNSALPIYEMLDRVEDGYAMLQKELPKSKTAYYLKADLASIAEDLGRKDEALRWSEEAYVESRGAATRFQWGNLYIGTLLRLAPQDSARIERVTAQVLGELAGEGRIYQRARTRLEGLDGKLRQWQQGARTQRAPVLRALRDRMQQQCVQIPATEPARKSCDAFLAGAA